MDLHRLLKPRHVVVIGVSTSKENHPANVIFRKLLLRYPVEVFAVNPNGGTLMGSYIYKALDDLPVTADLAVIAVRSEHVKTVLTDCIRCKVGGAVIISGGFAEVGQPGLQQELADIGRANAFPFLGPNCLGTFIPGKIDTLFLPGERMDYPPVGGVAIISQSGAFLVDLLLKFARQGLGISQAISIGNKALIRETDLLAYLAEDEQTRVITIYIEGFAPDEGRVFLEAAKASGKPIVVMKSGKTEAGSQAVNSHTASIAGNYRIFSDVIARHGVIEAKSEYELLSYCEVLCTYPQHLEGKVGIVSISGGHGAVASDLCVERGLLLATIPEDVQRELRSKLSPSIRFIASLKNPIDLTGSAVDDDFLVTCDVIAQIKEIEALLMLVLPYSPGLSVDLGAKVSNPMHKRVKPLVAYIPHVEKYQMFIEGFELNRVPVSNSIEGAVLMLEGMKKYRSV